MLEKLNLDVEVEKAVYKEEKDALSLKLGALQRRIKELGIPVLIIFEGWDAAGKGTLINDLMIPLDPRSFVVYNAIKPSDDEINRPLLWRYWTKTPEKGRMVLFDRSYYSDLAHRSKLDKGELKLLLHQANDFEKVLAQNGTVIIKFFIHISQKEQKKRFEKLEENPSTSWRVTEEDWRENKNYDKIYKTLNHTLEATDTDCGPWTLVEGHNKDYACLKIYNTLASRLQKEIEKAENAEKPALHPLISAEDDPYRTAVLESVDMDKCMDRETYKEELKKCQKKLRDLEYQIYSRRIPVVIGFEGWDAGGKGGAIKRLCENLDPRGYRVYPTAAPTSEELAHNWLWRFWKTVPKRGHFSIYDRTWYGRVMVEPIEGFCTADDYRRAFREINDFEKQLTDFGAVALKFWMNISKDEQEKRFKERENDPDKQWKITDEDWRNREKWDAYVVAVDRMLLKTSTENAPWIVVEGNDKYYARVKVLKTVIGAIEKKIAELDG
ncbi:polyphosphate:AMP phosphotransferase [Eubacterium sp. 1001713B170207_170306_E7]|uniref:polyphosphate:AMP phosphotransferase n=1 Tax=Eubacterium sp. 1001713B170207_170306_E7 TaxID=2787097 RepID=UPI0018986231|nr:polyphosphate:AMP phosphotransferase [Eubacterium sp. 1001713B170207_170306_E7]